MDFKDHIVDRKKTPQTKKVPGVKKQVKNNAGGISFKLNKWDYLKRFLIIGTECGTYYVGQKNLTDSALYNVKKCIKDDGMRTVNIIVAISVEGRAADNDYAIFSLAMCASAEKKSTRQHALSKLNDVCRITTHLFTFIEYVKNMRGWGRALRQAVAFWYTSKPADKLAYQMLKYKSRNGWSHADAIRLSHPIPVDDNMDDLFGYAVGKKDIPISFSDYAKGAWKLTQVASADDAALIIKNHRLTHEVVPNEFKNSRKVWEAMFESMPITAMVRNLGKMSQLELFGPFSEIEQEACVRLTNEYMVKKSRIHPIQVMNAYIVYKNGHSYQGSLSWEVSPKIVDALEKCFYLSFKNIEPSGKRIMLALDVSGSMTAQLNRSLMSCRVASAVLAMCTIKTEPFTETIGFTSGGKDAVHIDNVQAQSSRYLVNYSRAGDISRLPLSANAGLKEVVKSISDLPFAGTDCSLPFIYCANKGIDVDAVCIYTDNETYAGYIHPWQALDNLQQKLGHEVKCIVVGMTATRFSIARPEYRNMLDVVGFDTNTPSIISDFIKE